jgi:hypothetical protein
LLGVIWQLGVDCLNAKVLGWGVLMRRFKSYPYNQGVDT